MANTGKKIVVKLKEVKNPGNTPTGNTKDNVPEDADYIAPYVDLEDCPVVLSMTCPVVISTRIGTTLVYEFHLPDNVIRNPNVKKVTVETSTGGFIHSYNIPASPSLNYIFNVFTSLSPISDYDLVIKYKDASDVVLHTCNIDVV